MRMDKNNNIIIDLKKQYYWFISIYSMMSLTICLCMGYVSLNIAALALHVGMSCFHGSRAKDQQKFWSQRSTEDYITFCQFGTNSQI